MCFGVVMLVTCFVLCILHFVVFVINNEKTCVFFFQAEDGIRDLVRSRGLGDVYKRQDHVNINTKRQVGSTIKPLLYCLAVDNGYSPCQSLSLIHI